MEMERIGTPEVSKFLLSMDDKETYELTSFFLQNQVKARGNEAASKLFELLARRNIGRF